MVARQPLPLLQAMYYGPVIDRTGSSCSASDLQARSPRRRGATSDSVADAAAPAPADEEILLNRDLDDEEEEEEDEEQAYVVLLRRSPASSPCRGASCHAGQRPGRRRIGGNAIRILLVATAAAFLALAVTPVSCTSNKKEEETAVAATVVTEESTGLLGTRSRTGSDPGGGIDLLAALQLHNTTRQGVTQVPGLVRLKPAYYLQGEERELRLNEASFERAAALLRRVPEFTIAAALRQEEANSGTIVAFSHGNNRYLELQSSGRKDELRLHYVSRRDGTVHVEAFPFRLADGAWHRVALSISGSQVELLVDCHPLYRRLLRPGPPDTNFTLPQLQLWIGQRNARHFLFKGALQDVKLIPEPHGYLSQCPQLDSSCPTCGQFSILQNTVEQLMHNLNELTRRLAAAEGRISKVEECECQKSCRTNGTVHEDGATWEKGCQQCSCVHGEIECRPTPCAPVTCKNPVIPPGQCCPICLKQCYLHGVIYDHGEKVSPKQCVECDCFDGSFTCQRFDTETRCPPLPCPPNEQISVAEECCKFCPGVDYCAKGHKCHANASCLNLQTTYACHCDIGFQGDGHVCHDVDECKQQGGSEGHHCNANTRCVNVIGSYTCECLPGYHRVDKFNCAELDECTTGHHACDEHATCINTAGSYYCICKDGYSGDGYTCKPVCNQTCQNGGECVAPGRCSCRRGYIGNSCELDLDECASDLHRCHHSSTCFNMPGWYYCRCKPGYRSALHDSTQGTQCLDIDECNDQTIERRHTCHPSAKCVNTEGGYECVCPRDHSHVGEVCRLSCWFEGREINNGETFAPAGNPCRRCTCGDGVISCRDPICDCSAPGSHRDKCCPQCDPAASCRHQELHHLVFRSGERWIYQCQTCECLYGEIDCWQMECPPVTCPNPVTEDGDCCPRCEDDPCARELPANGTSLSALSRPRPCSYAGIIHDSGSSWQDPHDKCTTCECKDGQLCCSYDYGCAGDLGDNEQHRTAVSVPEPAIRGVQDPARPSLGNRTPEAAVPAITAPAATTEAASGYDVGRHPIVVTAVPESSALAGSGAGFGPDVDPDVVAARKSHLLGQQTTPDVRDLRRDERQPSATTARYQQSARGSTTHRGAMPTTASTPKATTSMAKNAPAWSKPVVQGQQPQRIPSQRRHLSAIKSSTASNLVAAARRASSFSPSSPYSPYAATSSFPSAPSASSSSTSSSSSLSSPPVTMVATSSILVEVDGDRYVSPDFSSDDRDEGGRRHHGGSGSGGSGNGGGGGGSNSGDDGDGGGGGGGGGGDSISASSSIGNARLSASSIARSRRKDDTKDESVARDSAT